MLANQEWNKAFSNQSLEFGSSCQFLTDIAAFVERNVVEQIQIAFQWDSVLKWLSFGNSKEKIMNKKLLLLLT